MWVWQFLERYPNNNKKEIKHINVFLFTSEYLDLSLIITGTLFSETVKPISNSPCPPSKPHKTLQLWGFRLRSFRTCWTSSSQSSQKTFKKRQQILLFFQRKSKTKILFTYTNSGNVFVAFCVQFIVVVFITHIIFLLSWLNFHVDFFSRKNII